LLLDLAFNMFEYCWCDRLGMGPHRSSTIISPADLAHKMWAWGTLLVLVTRRLHQRARPA
jgi:hypothetical protein